MYMKSEQNTLHETERTVLAILLQKGTLPGDIIPLFFHADFFSSPEHRLVHRLLLRVRDNGKNISAATLSLELIELEPAAGEEPEALLDELFRREVRANDLEPAMEFLVRHYLQRKIRESAENLGATLESEDADPVTAAEDALEQVSRLLSERKGKEEKSMQELFAEQIKRIEEIRRNATPPAGLESGFPQLDQLLYGFQPGKLYILGSRPAVGKTAFAVSVLVHMLQTYGSNFRPLYLSPSLSSNQLTQRILACISGVPVEKIARGKMEDGEAQRLTTLGTLVSTFRLVIDDRFSVSVKDLERRLFLNRNDPFHFIIIDTIQLLQAGRGRYRDEEVSYIMKDLRRLAVEYQVPVFILSELNRPSKLRDHGDSLPRLSDLRDSGSLEQEADVVLFLFRPEYYDITHQSFGGVIKGETRLLVAKNRTGPLDTVRLKSFLDIQRFVEMGVGEYEEALQGTEQPAIHTTWTKKFEEAGKKFNNGYDEDTPF